MRCSKSIEKKQIKLSVFIWRKSLMFRESLLQRVGEDIEKALWPYDFVDADEQTRRDCNWEQRFLEGLYL